MLSIRKKKLYVIFLILELLYNYLISVFSRSKKTNSLHHTLSKGVFELKKNGKILNMSCYRRLLSIWNNTK